MLSHLKFVLSNLIAVGVAMSSSVVTAESGKLPNIIVFLADDLGYGDVGCYGAKDIATPHIDSLCSEGMKFNSFYVHSTCSPTRLAFMTGTHADRMNGQEVIYWWDRIGISEDEITVPELLKQKGYATAAVGKWHMGHWPCFQATHHGFDTFLGFAGTKKIGLYRDLEELEPLEKPKTNGIYTESLLEAGISFMKENRDKPFFLYYASPMPHVPWQPGTRFKGTSEHGKYGDTVQEIDYQVGELMKTLDDLKIADNTLVIFVSDNGPQITVDGHGTAEPLRDGKWSCFEGGIRVPCIMRWPRQIPSGSVNNEIAGIIDLLPTFCEMTGTQVPTDRVVDGKNILPYMQAKELAEPIHDTFIVPGKTIRYNDWKLYVKNVSPGGPRNKWGDRLGAKKGTLFNLKDDIGETTDVSENHPEVVAELNNMMDKFMTEMRATKREMGKTADYTDEKRKAAWEAVRAGETPE